MAVVTTIGATVSAEVKESVGGTPINSDTVFDQFNLTTFNLPLFVEARLLQANPSATETPASAGFVAALATSRFTDPRLDVESQVNEFALNALGFNDTAVSLVNGRTSATEQREVVFQAGELDLEPDTAVEAQSFFFLDGILVLLARPGHVDFTGARAEMTIRVIQEREGQEPATVLQATVALVGNADGTASLAVDGALVADNLTTFGLVPTSSALGAFQAVVLPDLAIPYVYPADVDEKFMLKAEITGRYEAPVGTGAVVILGDGISDLISLMTQALGEDVVSDFEEGLAAGLLGISLPLDPLVAASPETTFKVISSNEQSAVGICGLMGAETALATVILAGFSSVWPGRRGRRYR